MVKDRHKEDKNTLKISVMSCFKDRKDNSSVTTGTCSFNVDTMTEAITNIGEANSVMVNLIEAVEHLTRAVENLIKIYALDSSSEDTTSVLDQVPIDNDGERSSSYDGDSDRASRTVMI